MSVDDVPKALDGRRPSPGLWLAGAAELGVAVAVAMIVFRTGRPPSEHPHGGHELPGMHWNSAMLGVALVAAPLLVWRLATRARMAAILAAVGLVCLGASEPVRMMVLHSHLIGMAALEVLLVVAPLLLVSAWHAPTAHRRRCDLCTVGVVVLASLYSALLIVLHLPAVHDRGSGIDLLPMWLPILVVIIGIGYWTAILTTAGSVPPAVRRGALVIGQEVAAILGLAALISPSSSMDQRLGGLLMLSTCAAVTWTLLKRLQQDQESRRLRMEHDVH